ncbi:SAM domain-containing protein SAMSN-1b [Antennarius striatus]|uniref:SAM domain-containing protein SAMSN-1b n=1 Tax=Antennarius striatus TaxID=241820 RepID=UPI0035B4C7A4
MNLFCFTLEGSTDSIYEPPYRQTLREARPKYQYSPALLRRRLEWGGSDPSISSSAVRVKRNNRRSCVTSSPVDNETLGKDLNDACRISSRDGTDSSHPITVQKKDASKVAASGDRTRPHLPAQAVLTTSNAAESVHSTGRLKKLQNLVQAKTGHLGRKGRSADDDDLRASSPVLTCIALGTRPQKKTPKTATSSNLHEQQEDPDPEEGVWSPAAGDHRWSPFECSQPWIPFYHTCHQQGVSGGDLSSPWTTDWDRFESLISELDSKLSDPSPPQTISSDTDLQLSQNTSTRFGRFSFREPLMKPQDDGDSVERNGDLTNVKLPRRKTETSSRDKWKHVTASPEKMTVFNGNAKKREDSEEGQFKNSLESLYSLKSGQSSSSGVTSGSNCSSNRDSLRLEEDLPCSRQSCGKARVHTDFVPSPYDTESLNLKVGDVIEVIAKPPMGIWTGMLNGRIGSFKFIYVDELREESPDTQEEEQTHKERQESTIQELLRRVGLEEYSSALQLNSYQTMDDLLTLREHHLTRLEVTDPEQRSHLLAAVDSLQQLLSDSCLENGANQEGENLKADKNNCPRDSGCHMPPCSSPVSITEETDQCEYPPPGETIASCD